MIYSRASFYRYQIFMFSLKQTRLLLPFLLIISLGGMGGRAMGQKKAFPLPASSAASFPTSPSRSALVASSGQVSPIAPVPLAVSIVIPDGISGDAIVLGDRSYHFDVVIQNVSNRPVRLWSYNCSWGFDNVSLQVLAINGKRLSKPILLTRGVTEWTANMPTPRVLPPHGIVVQEIHLYSDGQKVPPGEAGKLPDGVYTLPGGDVYINFPLPKRGEREQVEMRAFFDIPTDVWAKQDGIWTGRVTSAVNDYTVLWYP